MKINPKLVNKVDLANVLTQNEGILIIKFHATWCGPCKKIEGIVQKYFGQLPDTVFTVEVDIDQALDLYGFLKTKKVVNGIPVMLAYYKGNTHYVPDDIVIGTDEVQIQGFFHRCVEESNGL